MRSGTQRQAARGVAHGAAASTTRSSGAAARAQALGLSWADAMALLAVLLWGLNFPITKQVMTLLPPIAAAFIRSGVSSLVYIAVLGITGQWRLPERRDRWLVILLGLGGMGLNTALYVYGLHLTTASHSGLIYTLTPLFVFASSHLLGYLRLARRDLVGLALGLAGAVLIVGAPVLTGQEPDGASLAGDLLTGASALVWGVWMMLAAPLLARYGALRTTAWITSAGALGLCLPAAPALLAQDWPHLPWTAFAALAYSGLLAGALAWLLWYVAVGRLGAARTMVYANMESFFVVLFSALLLAERVEWTALVGGVAVVAGVLLTRRGRGQQSG